MCEAASKDQDISPSVTKASQKQASKLKHLMPKQRHTQSDNDSGPRLRGEGTNLGNG